MGRMQIFTGSGHGKSPAALGEAVKAAAGGKRVIVVQFLKGKGLEETAFQRKLEPEIKFFRFEKSDIDFASLPESKQQEERANIRNGLNFARKVINTGGCDLLVLDEVLGLVDNHIIETAELVGLLKMCKEHMDLILTGIALDESLAELTDEISVIEAWKH